MSCWPLALLTPCLPQALASSCAAARRIRTVTLTWMWMGMTLWNMGSHSILGALRDKAGLVGQAKGNKESHKHLQSLIHPKTPRVSVSAWARGSPPGDSTLTAHHKLGSIILDHLARYTEADVIPCTGEEPGEAKEREALRGAVLKQVWAQGWAGGRKGREALGRGSIRCPPSGLSCLPSGLTLSFLFPFSSGGPPSTRITPEFSKWASDGKS